MPDQQPGESGPEQDGGQNRVEARPPGPAGAENRPPAGRPGYWFPLLLFGGLVTLSLPLSVAAPTPTWTGYQPLDMTYPTVTHAMYLGGGLAAGPSPFPLGWYWVGMLMAGLPVTAAWYRWRDRRAGSRTPLSGYLASGLALTAATAALPLLAWGMPLGMELGGPPQRAWLWLDVFWRLGTFALLAVAVGLGWLAWTGRSRALAVITVSYTAAVCFAGWREYRQASVFDLLFPSGDLPAGLPAAVLLLAGCGAMLMAGARELRCRSAARQAADGNGSLAPQAGALRPCVGRCSRARLRLWMPWVRE